MKKDLSKYNKKKVGQTDHLYKSPNQVHVLIIFGKIVREDDNFIEDR